MNVHFRFGLLFIFAAKTQTENNKNDGIMRAVCTCSDNTPNARNKNKKKKEKAQREKCVEKLNIIFYSCILCRIHTTFTAAACCCCAKHNHKIQLSMPRFSSCIARIYYILYSLVWCIVNCVAF